MNRPRALDLLRGYYAITPLLAIAEILLNVPFRVGSFISSPGGRGLYYVGCTACAVAMFRWPRSARFLSLGESSLNIGILIVGLMQPLFSISVDAIQQGTWEPSHPTASLINFLLAGSVSLISFYLSAPSRPQPTGLTQRT